MFQRSHESRSSEGAFSAFQSFDARFFALTAEERITRVARLLDDAFRIPFLGFRVGLDPILDVIPVVGNVLGLVLSLYFFWEAWNLRVPWHVYLRMAGNIGIDAAAGAIPVLGVVTDALWKSNKRNARLLLKYARKSGRPRGHVDVLA